MLGPRAGGGGPTPSDEGGAEDSRSTVRSSVERERPKRVDRDSAWPCGHAVAASSSQAGPGREADRPEDTAFEKERFLSNLRLKIDWNILIS